MKKVIFYISVFFVLLNAAQGQDISISTAFDSTRILIGDQINFTVIVEQPADLRVNIPAFKDTLVKNIEILDGPDIDSTLINGRLRITERYLVTSFDSGYYEVDPIYIELKNPNGLNRFFSDRALLEVMKYRIAPVDSAAKFYDIIDPIRAPVTLGEILPWALLVLLAGVLTWFILMYLRKRKKTITEISEVVNPDPAHFIAFRELNRLKAEELWQKGRFKQYYTKLTEILRQYLENRYMVYSLELTTQETLDSLLRTGFKRDGSFDLLKNVLIAADLVKFAKYIPAKEENEIHFLNSWDFVDATKKVVVAPVPEVTNTGKEVSQ